MKAETKREKELKEEALDQFLKSQFGCVVMIFLWTRLTFPVGRMPTDLCYYPLRRPITTLPNTSLNTTVVEVTFHNTVSMTSRRPLLPNRTRTSLPLLHPAGTNATITGSSPIHIIRDSTLGTSLHYPSSTDTQDLDGPYYKNGPVRYALEGLCVYTVSPRVYFSQVRTPETIIWFGKGTWPCSVPNRAHPPPYPTFRCHESARIRALTYI